MRISDSWHPEATASSGIPRDVTPGKPSSSHLIGYLSQVNYKYQRRKVWIIKCLWREKRRKNINTETCINREILQEQDLPRAQLKHWPVRSTSSVLEQKRNRHVRMRMLLFLCAAVLLQVLTKNTVAGKYFCHKVVFPVADAWVGVLSHPSPQPAVFCQTDTTNNEYSGVELFGSVFTFVQTLKGTAMRLKRLAPLVHCQ